MQLMALPKKILRCGELSLDLSVPHVMGILNVTPDSFSDGGKHNGKAQALAHAQQMIVDGATVIDVGGESTRPGASVVEVEEEIRRVVPVVEALAELDVVISIDTSQPEVIQAAYRIGDSVTNVIAPMMSYFGLILAMAARYKKDLGMGTLIAMMLPYSMVFIVGWTILFYIWVFLLGMPVGPGAATYYQP